MARYDYDIAVVGAGSAGLTAARLARWFGKRVVLIDKVRLGGDCLHYGCVPSKALIKASRVAYESRTADRWGLEPHDTRADLGRVNARVADVIARVGALDDVAALAEHGVEVALGQTRFLDAHTLQVGDRRLRAKYVLLATGSSPAVPDIPGLAGSGVLTNEDVFSLDRLPPRLAVLGGGPVGAELAQALARLGSEVTVLTRAAGLLPRDDPDLVALLTAQFATEGITVHGGVDVHAVHRDRADLVVTIEGRSDLRVDQILCATGRRPNVADLDLAVAGVQHGPDGVQVDDRLRTTAQHIYAAGDVTGGPAYTHFAGYQAAHAVRNIVVPGSAAFDPGALPAVTFTDPEVARVGRADDGTAYGILRFPYSRHERALTDGESVGLIKILVGRDRRILGAHVAGHNAGELIDELTLAMNRKLTVDHIVGSIHAYPTYSFALPIALHEYATTQRPSRALRLGRLLARLT